MLLHELGHIKADKGFGRIEELLAEYLYKLGLSYACRAYKDKGSGSAARRNLAAASLDC